MGTFRTLKAYQKAFDLAVKIFEASTSFPPEEKYSLTDQIRRSSRSVCANTAEGYRKRIYPKHFKSKLTDADMENSETAVWSDFALKFGYIDQETWDSWNSDIEEIGKLLNFMMNNAERFR